MIHCYDMRCKYCNDKYKCTNKNVKLVFHGVETKFQGFKHFLECKSFEEHYLYKSAMELVKKIKELEAKDET